MKFELEHRKPIELEQSTIHDSNGVKVNTLKQLPIDFSIVLTFLYKSESDKSRSETDHALEVFVGLPSVAMTDLSIADGAKIIASTRAVTKWLDTPWSEWLTEYSALKSAEDSSVVVGVDGVSLSLGYSNARFGHVLQASRASQIKDAWLIFVSAVLTHEDGARLTDSEIGRLPFKLGLIAGMLGGKTIARVNDSENFI